MRLGAMGQLGEAIRNAEEAVNEYRRLADMDPVAHVGNLVAALSNLSNVLRAADLEEASRAATEEAEVASGRLGHAKASLGHSRRAESTLYSVVFDVNIYILAVASSNATPLSSDLTLPS